MSLLTNQSAINPDKNFWLSATGGNTIPFATALTFDTNPDGSTQGRILGNLSTLFLQTDNTITISKIPFTGNITAGFNTDATVQNSGAGLYVSSAILCDSVVASQGLFTNQATISSINGLGQNPTATRFGFYTQTASGSGVTPVANNQVQTSSIILVQPIGSSAPQTSTISYYANPVAGIGFASIASVPLDNPQSMSYYVLKW